MLRAKQIGLSLMEMEYLTIGEVYDMVIEQGNDYEEWDAKATQDDIDKFMKETRCTHGKRNDQRYHNRDRG